MKKSGLVFRLILILLLALSTQHFSQTADDLQKEISSLPEIKSVEQVKNDSSYIAVYRIMVDQLLNHNDAQSEQFTQKV